MRRFLDTTCPRCGWRESTEGLSTELVREIAASHVCPDGVRTPSGPPVERRVPGPGERDLSTVLAILRVVAGDPR